MGKGLMILLSAITLIAGLAGMEIGQRALTAGAFSMLSLAVVFLYPRFSRSTDDVPRCSRCGGHWGCPRRAHHHQRRGALGGGYRPSVQRRGVGALDDSSLYDRRHAYLRRRHECGCASRDSGRATMGGRSGCGDESAVLDVLDASASTPWHRWYGAADVGTLERVPTLAWRGSLICRSPRMPDSGAAARVTQGHRPCQPISEGAGCVAHDCSARLA